MLPVIPEEKNEIKEDQKKGDDYNLQEIVIQSPVDIVILDDKINNKISI